MSGLVLWELDVTFQQRLPCQGCLVITHAGELQAEQTVHSKCPKLHSKLLTQTFDFATQYTLNNNVLPG